MQPKEVLLLNFAFKQLEDIVVVRQRTRQIMALLGFKNQEQTRMATAVSEITRNACQYAKGGTIQYNIHLTLPSRFIINIIDKGKGIPNLSKVFDEKRATKTGLGLGIVGARRLVDAFTLHVSGPEGTHISLMMEAPGSLVPSPLVLGKIAEELVRHRPRDFSEELLQQNRELMQAFNLLKSAREELEQGVLERTKELIHTNKVLQHEIERRKEIEHSLREVTERLYLTLGSAKVGTWRWIFKDNKLIWDKYACSLFGIELEKFDSNFETFLKFLPVEDRIRFQDENSSMIGKKKDQPIEFRIVWPDGSIHHLMSRGRVNYDEQGLPINMLGIYLDITEHIQTKEKLQVYREQMVEVSRTSSLGEMASSLAHEINQPLAAINAYISGCIKRIENNRSDKLEILEALKQASQQAERAGEVVHRIKSFVRKGELFYENVMLDDLIGEAIQVMQHEIEKFSVEIIYHACKIPLLVNVDKIQIQQVLLNLIRNAMEAMHMANTASPKINIKAIIGEAGLVKIQVVDNGPGFSEVVGSHLFEPYFTTRPQGMGLGLAICRSIIEAHGGQLTALSLASGGSCFEFNLSIFKENPDA